MCSVAKVAAACSSLKRVRIVSITNYLAAITKNGMQRLTQPAAIDTSKYKSDKKIEDEEILKILEQPIGKTSTKKNKKKKKKPAKKATATEGAAPAEEEEEESDE
jgi:hypothetical protein